MSFLGMVRANLTVAEIPIRKATILATNLNLRPPGASTEPAKPQSIAARNCIIKKKNFDYATENYLNTSIYAAVPK